MEDKITSIAKLKREIERQKNAHMGEGVLDLIWVLDLINSLEAGLRGRLKGLEKMAKHGEYNDAVAAEELRRVLGGGEEGRG